MSHPHATAEHPARSATTSPMLLVLLCAAQLMLVLDITAMNVALPTVGADLDVGGGRLSWVITAYVVTFGGFMLLGGRLADVLGHRRMLMIGMVVFAAGSLACGLADSWSWLVAGRAFQGLGAALLSPAALASLTRAFDGPARVKALAAWATVGTVGFVAGLVFGGALTSGPGWRWIFLVNLPVAGLMLAVGPRLLERDTVGRRPAGLDLPGAVLTTTTVALLVYGLSVAGEHRTLSPLVVGLLAATLASAAALAVVERRHPQPLLNPRVVRQGTVLRGLVVMLAASAAMLSTLFLASVYAQRVLDLSPLAAGLLFVPSAVATMVGARAAAHALPRHGTRAVAAAAFLLVAGGAAVLTQVHEGDSARVLLALGLSLASVGLGPAFVTATSSALVGVRPEDAGLTSGVVNTGHEVGGALGLGAVAAGAGAALVTPSAVVFADAFAWIAVIAAAMAAVSWRLVPAVRPDAAHVGHGH